VCRNQNILKVSLTHLIAADIYIAMVSSTHNVCAKDVYVAIVSTIVETENPEREIVPGLDLLGPIYDKQVPSTRRLVHILRLVSDLCR
jgi:RAB protein geranylgeranyltransferase component A